ncbi:MAG: hypothetical protein HRU17_16775, partial [Polyangiaceae bacterium]|nr:hypothetical protein [Polyangiaceae bacterium]
MFSSRSRFKNVRLTLGALCVGATVVAACSGVEGGSNPASSGDGGGAGVTAPLQPSTPVETARVLAADVRLMHHLDGEARSALRHHGHQLLRHTRVDGPAARLDLRLSTFASSSVKLNPILHPEHGVTLTPRYTTNALGKVDSEGRVTYENAYRSVDVVRTLDSSALHETLVITEPTARETFRWDLEISEGLEVIPETDGSYTFYGADGLSQMRLSPVEIVDATGKASTGRLLVNSGAGQVTLRVDHSERTLPVVVSFSASIPETLYARAVTTSIVKGRVMVILDTSGSMIWRFSGDQTMGGDGLPGGSAFCDGNLDEANVSTTGTFLCSDNVDCTLANGAVAAFPYGSEVSRMFAAKEALTNVINAHSGLLDFGLTRYIENNNCPDSTYCCTPTNDDNVSGRCEESRQYTDFFNGSNDEELTYRGGCGTPLGGGRVLVQPHETDASLAVLPWVDHVEDFCEDTGNAGHPRDPEIRGAGGTPLGRSVISARTDWYQPIYDISQDSGNSADPDYDELIDCRSYALVVMTDGIESCEAGNPTCGNGGDCTSGVCVEYNGRDQCTCVNGSCPGGYTCIAGDCYNGNVDRCNNDSDCVSLVGAGSTCNEGRNNPGTDYCYCASDSDCDAGLGCDEGLCVNADERPFAVSNLVAVNSTNPVKVYPLGMGNTSGLDVDELDAMAVAGGTGPTAAIATSQSEIEAAFADIVADSAKYEICNDLDDNCNTYIDEGLQVLESCDPEGANTCSGGQTCDASGRCPCTGGAGQCNVGYTCDALDGNGGVCRNSCTVDVFSCSAAGVRKCGSDGAATCCEIDGNSVCTELADPTGEPETCDNPGVDDDCNGLIDDGPDCTGCLDIEICNGVDDDCDVTVDESPLFQLSDLCDVDGDCNGGTCIDGECGCNDDAQCETGYKCSSSSVCRPECGTDVGECNKGYTICDTGGTDAPACVNSYDGDVEICDGLDNDCDGFVDEGLSDPNSTMSQSCYSYGSGTGDPTVGVGLCQLGSQVCTAVVGSGTLSWGTCDGEVNPAASDPCDGQDNNCNGQIDEGNGVFEVCTADGDCGANCNTGRCDCSSDADCGNGFECSFGLCHTVCSIGTDACQTDGVNKCDNGSATCCLANFDICSVATAGTPTTEICDGINNDCDGQIDEIDGTCCPLGCTGDGSGGDPYVGVGACSPGGYI